MGRSEWAVSEVPARGRAGVQRGSGQSVALLVGGLVGSLLLVPATRGVAGSVLSPERARTVSDGELGDRSRTPDGVLVRARVRIDPSSALQLRRPEEDPYVLVALVEPADVVLFGRASHPEIAPVLDTLHRVSVVDPDAVANREIDWPARTLRGRLHDVGDGGDGFDPLSPEDVLAFTRGHLAADEPRAIRILELEERDVPGRGPAWPAWFLWGWAVAAVAAFWGSLFWTRRRAREPAEAPAPADLVVRDPGLVTALCLLTLGLYPIYWNWVATRALRRIAGRSDLIPAIDLILSVLTLGVWGVYVHVRNAAIVDSLLEPFRASNVRWQVLGLYLASIFCSLTVLGALFRLAEGVREVTWLGLRGELPGAAEGVTE